MTGSINLNNDIEFVQKVNTRQVVKNDKVAEQNNNLKNVKDDADDDGQVTANDAVQFSNKFTQLQTVETKELVAQPSSGANQPIESLPRPLEEQLKPTFQLKESDFSDIKYLTEQDGVFT